MTNDKNLRLVYSDESPDKDLRKSDPTKTTTPPTVKVIPNETLLKIRVEKKGRGGKAVSVIFNLPHNPDYFTKLTKKIKNQCGTGGTFKDGQIEIQGDQRDKIKSFLEKAGFQVKLAGG